MSSVTWFSCVRASLDHSLFLYHTDFMFFISHFFVCFYIKITLQYIQHRLNLIQIYQKHIKCDYNIFKIHQIELYQNIWKYPQTLRAIPPPSLTSKIGPFCALWTQKSVFGTQKSEFFVPFGLPWTPLGRSLSISGRQSRKSKKKGSLPGEKLVHFGTFFHTFS